MATTQATSSYQVKNINDSWASIWSIVFETQVYKDLFYRYGNGFKVLDMLRMSGNFGQVAGRTLYAYDEAAWQRNVTIDTAIATGAAGGNITIAPRTADFDSDASPILQVGDIIAIPETYQPAGVTEPRNYWISAIASGAGTNEEKYTAIPFENSSSASTPTQSQISVEVPIGTELMIVGNAFASGTGQPTSTSVGKYRRAFYTSIIKTDLGIEGGQIAQDRWEPLKTVDGKTTLLNQELVRTEFKHDDAIDKFLLLGEVNNNTSNLVQTSDYGGSNQVRSGYGYWKWLSQLAQSQTYTGEYDMNDFDDVKDLLQSQGVVGGNVFMGVGPDLMTDIENSNLDFIKEYSGGTNLYNDSKKKLGVDIKLVHKNGVMFHISELASFTNPNSYGNSAYQFRDGGFICPMDGVQGYDSEMKAKTFPNLGVMGLNSNGEDRTRIMNIRAGVNGLGLTATSDTDGMYVDMLSEIMLMAMNINQHIKIRKV